MKNSFLKLTIISMTFVSFLSSCKKNINENGSLVSYKIASIPESVTSSISHNLYLSSADGSGSKFIIETGKGMIFDIIWSEDAEIIYYTASSYVSPSHIYSVKLNGLEQKELLMDSGCIEKMFLSNSRSKIYYSAYVGNLQHKMYEFNLSNPEEVVEIGNGKIIALSPDETFFLFENDSKTYKYDIAGSEISDITISEAYGKEYGTESVSINNEIALITRTDSTSHLYTMNQDVGEITEIAVVDFPSRFSLWGPKWSPDGSTIAIFQENDFSNDFTGQIILFDKSSKSRKQLTSKNLRYYHFEWLPNGEEIIYYDYSSNIFSINVSSRQEHQITNFEHSYYDRITFSVSSKELK